MAAFIKTIASSVFLLFVTSHASAFLRKNSAFLFAAKVLPLKNCACASSKLFLTSSVLPMPT